MSKGRDRMLGLLKDGGIKYDECDNPPPLDLKTPTWSYHTTSDSNENHFWIYEFENIEYLRNSIDELLKLKLSEDQEIKVSANGYYLLVIIFEKADPYSEQMYKINNILMAFSGDF